MIEPTEVEEDSGAKGGEVGKSSRRPCIFGFRQIDCLHSLLSEIACQG